jgi:hypothetical protein
MPRVKWGTGTEVLTPSVPKRAARIDVLEPGQFEIRYGSRCGDCNDFIRKGETAGFNDDDEIVCEGCWVPYADR